MGGCDLDEVHQCSSFNLPFILAGLSAVDRPELCRGPEEARRGPEASRDQDERNRPRWDLLTFKFPHLCSWKCLKENKKYKEKSELYFCSYLAHYSRSFYLTSIL